MRAVYFETLRRIERSGYDVFTTRARVPRPRQALIALQAVAVAASHDAALRRRSSIGAGFAGLERRRAAGRRGARASSCSRRAAGSAAARPRSPIARPASCVDNGQHVLLGCYTRDVRVPATTSAPTITCGVQPQLGVTMIDRAGAGRRLACPSLPSPLHLLAGVFDWDALAWRDRLSVLRMATPLRLAQSRAAAGRGGVDGGVAGRDRRELADRNGQTARLREMLWDPLALAALNQPPTTRRRPPSRACSPRCSDAIRAPPRSCCPTVPLDAMYAEPARAFIERSGGDGADRRAARRRASTDERGRRRRRAAASRWTPRSGDRRPCRGSRLPTLFDGDAGAARRRSLGARGAMASSPIVTVNLWFDRPVMDEPFVGLPGRAMQWVFDKRPSFGDVGVAPVAGVERRGRRCSRWTNADAHRARRTTSCCDALPAARQATLLRGDRHPRAAGDVLAGARPAGAPGDRTAVHGPVSRRRLDRHRIARYDRERRPQRPLGRRRSARQLVTRNHVDR